MNYIRQTFIFFLLFLSVGSYAQSRDWFIDSLIHQISVESYRRHFDSLCTNVRSSRRVVASEVQSADHDACRNYIFRSFQNYFGVDNAYLHKFDLDEEKGLANVIGYKEGTSPWKGIIIISAHYDSNNNLDHNMLYSSPSPGANDNGTGLAAILEIARVLSGIETEHSVLLAAWDAEEFFTDFKPTGSNRWLIEKVTRRKPTEWQTIGKGGKIMIEDIRLNINFDMFGNPLDSLEGKPLLWVCSGNSSHKSFLDDYVAVFEKFVPDISAINYGKLISSDHYTFASRNIPSVENLESNYNSDPFYHTVFDNLQNADNIDFNFATNVSRGGLAFTLEKVGLCLPSLVPLEINADEVFLSKRDGYYCLKTNFAESTVKVYDYSGEKVKVSKNGAEYCIYPEREGYFFIYVSDFYRNTSKAIYFEK